MRIRSCFVAVAAILTLSSVGRAQQVGAADTTIATLDPTSAISHTSVESSMDRPSAAVQRGAPSADVGAALATRAGLGRSKALMVFGGAAILVGAAVGGDGGRVIMLGGAVVGLYGLWLYLQ